MTAFRFRVVRDIGNGDLPVGTVFDADAVGYGPGKVRRLVEASHLEPETPEVDAARAALDAARAEARSAYLAAR